METATKLRQCPNCFSECDGSLDTCPICGYAPASQSAQYPLALEPGRILAGRYILGRVLGQGGFGITYLAWDSRERTRVALKEFFPDNLVMRQPGATQVTLLTADREENFLFGREQFLSEAKTLAQFAGNPNIVGVYSYFEENGTAYFTMEYVQGKSLKEYLREREGRLSWDEAVKRLVPIMDALQEVHAKGIVHRDIKPDNIYITEDGHAKLLDFGSARYSLGDRSRSLDVVLTAGYAPKEQYARHGRQGPYTDIYSLAACFYACLSGRVPTESVERMYDDDLPQLSAMGVKLPAQAEDAILKGLSIRGEDRWQSIADFKAHLLPEAADNAGAGANAADGGTGGAAFTGDTTRTGGNTFTGSTTATGGTDGAGSTSFTGGAPGGEDAPGKAKKRLSRGQILGIAAGAALSLAALILVVCLVIPFNVGDKAVIVEAGSGIYTGTVVGGKPHGEGKMVFNSGDVYDGSWEKGVMDGEGTMTYANGDVYEGGWWLDERSGEGTMTYANGEVYEGNWRYDGRDGTGSLHMADGIRTYTGEWEDGVLTGEVTLTLSFNEEQGWVSTMVSTYADGEPVGDAVYTAVNGETFSGDLEYVEDESLTDGLDYTGLLMDGIPHGFGIIEIDGASYIGELVEASFNGVGCYEEGDVYYIGEWEDDLRSGYGYNRYVDGSVFEGNWVNDLPSGQGKYTYVHGGTAEGEWSYSDGFTYNLFETASYTYEASYVGLIMDGVPCGFGAAMLEFETAVADGENVYAFYTGEFKDGHPEGEGTFIFSDEEELTGNWSFRESSTENVFLLDGVANGAGMRELNGETYLGEYRDGQPNGYGNCLYGEDTGYYGNWVNGERSGYGVMIYDSGDWYEGGFSADMRSGQGIYHWADGDRFEGGFVNDKRHGEGTYYWADGDWFEGEWVNGEQNGYGVCHWPDGDWLEGNFVNALANGQCTYHFADGDWLEGEWVDGQQHGRGTYYWVGGGSRSGTWEDGELISWD